MVHRLYSLSTKTQLALLWTCTCLAGCLLVSWLESQRGLHLECLRGRWSGLDLSTGDIPLLSHPICHSCSTLSKHAPRNISLLIQFKRKRLVWFWAVEMAPVYVPDTPGGPSSCTARPIAACPACWSWRRASVFRRTWRWRRCETQRWRCAWAALYRRRLWPAPVV